jgi:DNA-binding IclR family transcriptional regulator
VTDVEIELVQAEDDERLGIQSVEVAATILAAMTKATHPLALKDLAQLSEMPAGKVHRYLVSLGRTGFVSQDRGNGRYGIGHAAIALGLAGVRSIDAVRCASAALAHLRDDAGETALLAIWTRSGPVITQLEDSNQPLFMNIRVGSILPILRSAIGQVFAAYLAADETRELLHREVELLRHGIEASEYSRASISARLARIREQGFASVTGQLVPGITAIAAPVLDHRGSIVAAVAVIGRMEDMDEAVAGLPANVLRSAAERISRQLGYVPSEA